MITHNKFIEERDRILGELAFILGQVDALKEKEFESSYDWKYIDRLEGKLNDAISGTHYSGHRYGDERQIERQENMFKVPDHPLIKY